MHSNIVVTLEDGTYDVSQHTLAFGPQDSGTNGHTVVYTAAPGAHPILSGGRPVTGWHLVPGSPTTWTASVPAGFTPDGLPVGVQIVGRNNEDFSVLQMAHAFERATGFGEKHPAIA